MSRTFFQETQQKIKAQGSALILALFIIIVLTFLGMALMRVLSTSSETIAQEVIGTRALMAANSGMQSHLQKLFPLNPPSNSTSSCPADKTYHLPESGTDIPGLYHCKASTQCTVYFEDKVAGIDYYRLTSTGECGAGDISAESSNAVLSSRTIQVEARSL